MVFEQIDLFTIAVRNESRPQLNEIARRLEAVINNRSMRSQTEPVGKLRVIAYKPHRFNLDEETMYQGFALDDEGSYFALIGPILHNDGNDFQGTWRLSWVRKMDKHEYTLFLREGNVIECE